MILVKVHEHEPAAAHRIETFPCIIGRSMRCTVRVEDPSVSGIHAEIVSDQDGFLLKDLGSTNGLVHSGNKVKEVRLRGNEAVFFGDVRLDFVVEEQLQETRQNVLPPAEMIDSGKTAPIKVVVALVIGFFAVLAVPAADQYRVYWPPERPIELLGTAAALWAGLVGVAFVFSLFCKLNSKRFRYHRILVVMIAGFVMVRAVGLLVPTLIFNLHNVPLASKLLHLGYAATAFLCIFDLQRHAFPRWTKRVRAIVATIAAVSAIFAVELLERHGSFGERDHMASLGLPLGGPPRLHQTAEDLLFDVALSIAESDERRIKTLERLEAERDEK